MSDSRSVSQEDKVCRGKKTGMKGCVYVHTRVYLHVHAESGG